jgi:hypothetical protein
MARTRPRLGLRHPTVVPTNFESETDEHEAGDDRSPGPFAPAPRPDDR